MTELVLHNYFRSSTSIRVRAALNLKGLDYLYAAYALLQSEHRAHAYLTLNPQGLVPALQISPEKVLTQSLAIIEYLDEVYPTPRLLPEDALGRARVRALAMIIGCDIHPLNNLRVLQALRKDFAASDGQVTTWFQTWVHEGFAALENRLDHESETGAFCHGDEPGLADICLYAQVLNNQRFNVDMTPFPNISEIFARCESLPAFANAHPARQPDAV
ncbi:MAG: maleylacetoacetate isomerase [Gammaproteobacteria bacterium]|nr:maleylacetoacetate isomerase [Gammaproteobacteria bacterium]